MSSAEQAHEPTMEEILASIRRIIADDGISGEKGESDKAAGGGQESGAAAGEAELDAEMQAADMQTEVAPVEEDLQDLQDMAAPQAAGESEEMSDSAQSGVALDDDFDLTDIEVAGGDDDGDVLELTEDLAVTPEDDAVDPSAAVRVETDVIFQDPSLEDEADEAVSQPEPKAQPQAAPPPRAEGPSGLVSSEASATVSSAFQSLENFVLSTQSRTLEDLVSEMLKPMLKAWLDANLPVVVERLVREEIERVSRGRR